MNRSVRWLGIGGALSVSLAFPGLLWPVIHSLPPEMDLGWHIPAVLRHAEGRSAWGTLVAFLEPGPALFSWPAMMVFPWLFQGRLHWPFSSMVLLSVLVHMANAGCVFWTGRELGLSRGSSVLAALLFLTMFIHFHAYLWPMATQHSLIVFSLLITLGLYLRTERAMDRREPRRLLLYGLTLLVAWAGSLQQATLILPPLILVDLLLSSRSGEQRGVRYDRWVPLFLVQPIYSILQLALVGDRVTSPLFAAGDWPAGARVAGLYAPVLASVVGGRWLVRARHGPRLLGVGVLVGFLFLFPLRDKRQILFAYNALGPFTSALASFLDPFEAALRMDSTMQYYFIPAQISGFAFLLTVLCVALFWFLRIREQRRLWILFVWYAVCLTYIFLHPHVASSFPAQMVSRYFIYFTPVVAWVVSSVLFAVLEPCSGGSRMRRAVQGLVLSGLLLGLCGANLVAIRVAVFRGKFFNTYGIYDDLRIAQLIREDLERSRVALPAAGVEVYVNRMVPLDYLPSLGQYLPPGGVPFENFRLVASDALRKLPVRGLHVNAPPPYPAGARIFQVTGARLEDTGGHPADLFLVRFEQGLQEWAQGRSAEAIRLLEEAASARPFLLRYLLGSCRLEDARWITRGAGLREWLEEVIRRFETGQAVAKPKLHQTAAIVRAELLDYGLCLLHLAYLKHREGYEEESQDWLNELRLLEPDQEFLAEWLDRAPTVRTDPEMREFLRRIRGPSRLDDPASGWERNEGLGPFLGRLLKSS